MADETTRVIKIEVQGGPNVDKAASSVDKFTDNTKKAKESTKDFKSTVDDAGPALDSMTDGAVGFAEGAAGMTKASLAFIATPIGAVIGALGIAIGAVVAYFKSSETAQDRWNKVMAVGSAVVEQLMNFVEDLGEVLVNAFTEPGKTLEAFWQLLKQNVVNRFEGLLELIPKLGTAIGLLFEGKFMEAGKVATDAVGKVTLGIESVTDVVASAASAVKGFVNDITDAVNIGIAAGLRLAAIQSQLDSQDRELIVKRAQTNLEVAKLREAALTEEGDAKRATIQEAIELEQALADKELEHALLKQEQAQLELTNNGNDKEAKMKVAEATAAVITAEAQRYEATLRFQKEIEKLHDAEAKQIQKNLDDRKKAEEKALKDSQKAQEEAEKLKAETLKESLKKELDMKKEATDFQNKMNEHVTATYIKGLDVSFDATKINYKGAFELFKKGKLQEVYTSTKSSAIKSYESLASIPYVGPILGFAAAAAATAFGLSQATGLLGISLGFSSGGYTGDGGKHEAKGIVHGGEFVVPKETVSAFGGPDYFNRMYLPGYADGGFVTNQATQSNNDAVNLAKIMENLTVIASWKEFTELDTRIKFKQEAVTA